MRLSSDRLSCEITFDDYDDQDVMIPYSDGEDEEFCLGIGRVTLCGVDGQTLVDLANEIHKLFGKALPKIESAPGDVADLLKLVDKLQDRIKDLVVELDSLASKGDLDDNAYFS